MIRIAPTTAMAEMALVSDISGVCSSGETRFTISKPKKSRQHEHVQTEFVGSCMSLSFERLRFPSRPGASSAHDFAHPGMDDSPP